MERARAWLPVVLALWSACTPSVDEPAGMCTDGQVRACGSSVGACATGSELCVGAEWTGVCAGAVLPTAEACNLEDDDCDGEVDENPSVLCARPLDVASATCDLGRCDVVACMDAALGSCDADLSNGCETSLTTWFDCGGCGVRCDAEEDCHDGACVDVERERRVVTFGGPSTDEVIDVAVGTDESVFALVRFRESIIVGSQTFTTPGGEGSDLVLVKLSRHGEVLWATATESAGTETARIGPARDGGVYVAGELEETTRFVGRLVPAPIDSDAPFVAHFAADGTPTWLLEGAGSMSVLDLASAGFDLALAVVAEEGTTLDDEVLPAGASVLTIRTALPAVSPVIVSIPTLDDARLRIAQSPRDSRVIAGVSHELLKIGDEPALLLPEDEPVMFVAALERSERRPRWIELVHGLRAVIDVSAHEDGVDVMGLGDGSISAQGMEVVLGLERAVLARFDLEGRLRSLEAWGSSRVVGLESMSPHDLIVLERDDVRAYPQEPPARWSRSLWPGVVDATASGARIVVAGGHVELDDPIDGVTSTRFGGADAFVWWMNAR